MRPMQADQQKTGIRSSWAAGGCARPWGDRRSPLPKTWSAGARARGATAGRPYPRRGARSAVGAICGRPALQLRIPAKNWWLGRQAAAIFSL
jgi:hypothetical protein